MADEPSKLDQDGAEGAPLSRRERKKAETRRRLYDTAMQLFREQGFADTTIEQITERVDVAAGTFFNYFPSKEAILTDYHRETTESFLAFAREIESDDLRERYAALSAWQEERVKREGQLYRVLVHEFLSRPELIASSHDNAKPVVEFLIGWIDEAKQKGQVREDISSMLALSTIMAIWNQTMLEWTMMPEVAFGCSSLTDRLSIVFDGLKP